MVRRHIVRYIRLGGGFLLVIFGVVGGFVPVLQGWVFVVAGLTIMSPESKRARGLLDWAKRKAGMKRHEPAAGDSADTGAGADTTVKEGS